MNPSLAPKLESPIPLAVRLASGAKDKINPEREGQFLEAIKAHPGDLHYVRALGDFYLSEKDFSKAKKVFQGLVLATRNAAPGGENFYLMLSASLSLGETHLGEGNFLEARQCCDVVLRINPRYPQALKLRLQVTQKKLAGLDAKNSADEIAKLELEMRSDRAMLLALNSSEEKDKLAQLHKRLETLHEEADKADLLKEIQFMAQEYLTLADQKYADPKDVEFVRAELNGLAIETFSVLIKFAEADNDPSIHAQAPLFSGYALMTEGKIDDAVKIFETIRKDSPEAESILKRLETDRLKLLNLAGIEVWEIYNQEREASGKYPFTHWLSEKKFLGEIKRIINQGEANTIQEALKVILDRGNKSPAIFSWSGKTPPDEVGFYERALYYTNELAKGGTCGTSTDFNPCLKGGILFPLLQYVAKVSPEPKLSWQLHQRAWEFEYSENGAQTPFAVFNLLHAFSPEQVIKDRTKSEMEALQGNSSFGRSFSKILFSVSPESIALDVCLMFASAGLGNLAKLAALNKLEKAGVTGYKALVIAGAAGIGAEATALWSLNTMKAGIQDSASVFNLEHLAKSYGATLLMVTGLKSFGKLGEIVGPRAAKSLGLITGEGTQLTLGGKALVWTLGHSSGLTGLLGTTQLNQALHLNDFPLGGVTESIAGDVLSYVEFAVAHKVADQIFSGKLSEISQKQHGEIARKEAVMAKSAAFHMGYKKISKSYPEDEIPESRILIRGAKNALNSVGIIPLLTTGEFETLLSYGVALAGVGAIGLGAVKLYSRLKRERGTQAKAYPRKDVRRRILELRDSKEPEAVEELIDYLKQKPGLGQIEAARALGIKKAKEAIPELRNLLKDKNSSVRTASAITLAKFGIPEGIQELQRLLGDKDSMVRMDAVRTLGEIGAKESIPNLKKIMNDPNPDVRREVTKALFLFDAEKGPEQLKILLKNKDSYTRLLAVQKLIKSADPSVCKDVVFLLNDPDSSIREVVAKIIGKLGFKEATEKLRNLLKNEKEDCVRIALAETLIRFGDKEKLLILQNYLRDGDSVVQIKIAQELGEMGVKEATPLLLELLYVNDDSPKGFENWVNMKTQVRMYAAESLVKLGEKRGMHHLKLILRHHHWQIVQPCIEILKGLKATEAIEDLKALLSDQRPLIAEQAKDAIRSIQAASLN